MIWITAADPSHLADMHMSAPEGLRLSLRRPTYHHVMAQIVVSEAYALFEGPDSPAPFALGGGAETPSGELAIWFVVRPGGLSTSLLLSIVRFARTMLRARPPMMTHIVGGNVDGARLARLCGFEKSAVMIGNYEEWRR